MRYNYKDFVITKGLNKTEYKGKRVPPHAALALKLEKRGIPVPVNTRLEFLYINIDKKNKLQDKKERRAINADANLKVVFKGKKKVSMFEMTKLVSKHLS